MAMQQITDPGGDWWAANAPSPDAPTSEATAGPDAFASQVGALYAKYGRQAPTSQEIESHRGNPQGLAGVESLLKQANGGVTPVGNQPTSGDDAIRAQVAKWAAMPGADPSLSKDPEYWVRQINAKGGLSDSTRQYWQDASVGPTAFFNNPNRESGTASYGGLVNGDPNGFGATPAPYVSNPNAPAVPNAPAPLASYSAAQWTGGDAPAAPNLERFTAPTMADLQSSPGYMSRLDALRKGGSRYYAGRGLLLNPGSQVALDRQSEDYASNEYGNLFGQKLAGTTFNNSTAQTGFGDAFQSYMAKYGQFQDANANNLTARQQNVSENNTAFGQGQQNYGNRYTQYLDANSRSLADYLTNVTTKRNSESDLWGRLSTLYGTGAGLAGNSYKPGIGTA